MTAPVIETPRLILRPHTIDDFADCAAMWADPEVTRFIGGRPFTQEETWSRLVRYAGLWSLLGFGYWVIEERSSGRYVGEGGFADFHRDIEPSLGEAPEAGWALVSRVHGRGYATEAMEAALRWADRSLDASQTVCLISPDHAASIRVAGKVGFARRGLAVYKGHATLVMERERR